MGLVAWKSSPGTHEYQNVPMPAVLELAFVNWIVKSVFAPTEVELMTALGVMFAK